MRRSDVTSHGGSDIKSFQSNILRESEKLKLKAPRLAAFGTMRVTHSLAIPIAMYKRS